MAFKSSQTHLKDEGGIEALEIEDIQMDNANQTITVYVRIDI
jgi:hypothetical protein